LKDSIKKFVTVIKQLLMGLLHVLSLRLVIPPKSSKIFIQSVILILLCHAGKQTPLLTYFQCSASCGTGVSFRTAHCPAVDDGTCGEPPSPQRKVCSGNFTRVNNKFCKGRKLRNCKEDESKYCAFHLLKRYCQLKGFRRLCCKSCADHNLHRNNLQNQIQVVSY